MLASFIIPSYNSAHTVKRCLDSIYSLPLETTDFEVILVDDCSTDNSVELVKEYARDRSNLVLLCQSENHRQGAARNRGIACAKGEYVVFVDSDDETCFGVLQALAMAKESSLDMVAMRTAKVQENSSVDEGANLPYGNNELFTGIELQTEHPFWFTGPVAYVYSKLFLDEVNYPFAEEVLFEDSDFVNVHLYHAKRMAYCDECGYKVHFNPDSTTHTMSFKHLSDYVLLGTRMLDFYHGIEDKTTKYAESILEGGSFNVMKSFRRLYRLGNAKEVRAFYERLDLYCDRTSLLDYRKPSYCWTRWTRFCLKHSNIVVVIMAISIFGTKLLGRIK